MTDKKISLLLLEDSAGAAGIIRKQLAGSRDLNAV